MAALALLAGLLVLGTRPSPAQTLGWERVGDQPLDIERPSFAPDGTLWGTGRSRLRRLPPPYGPAQAWTELPIATSDPVYALGQDTLVTYRAGLGILRSVDGGATFRSVADDGVGSISHYLETVWRS